MLPHETFGGKFRRGLILPAQPQEALTGGAQHGRALGKMEPDVSIFRMRKEARSRHRRHADLTGHPMGKLDIAGVAEG